MARKFRFHFSAGLIVTLMLAGFGVLWARQSRGEAEVSRRNETQAALAVELEAIRREIERLRREMKEADALARRERSEIREVLERLLWR